MATTASQAISGILEISNRIQSNRSRLAQIQALAANAANDLEAMAAAYASLITDINTAANAAPTNAGLQSMKGNLALLQAEFQALLAKAQQMESAVQGITF